MGEDTVSVDTTAMDTVWATPDMDTDTTARGPLMLSPRLRLIPTTMEDMVMATPDTATDTVWATPDTTVDSVATDTATATDTTDKSSFPRYTEDLSKSQTSGPYSGLFQ